MSARRLTPRSAGRSAAILACVLVALIACDARPPSRPSPLLEPSQGPPTSPPPAPPAPGPPPVGRLNAAFAFASSREAPPQYIYLTDGEESAARRLTSGRNPDWSRHGRIVFEATGGRFPPMGIYVIDEDGTDERYLGEGRHPRWTSDGRHIGFVARGSRDIYKMDVDRPDAATHVVSIPPEYSNLVGFEWSPHGREIAFSACKLVVSDDFADCAIFLWSADGGSPPVAIHFGAVFSPAWSADGSQLAFDREGVVFVTDATRRSARPVGNGWKPAWTPDGRLVFQRSWQGSFGTRIVILDGAERLLVPEVDTPRNPRYSDYEFAIRR